ncbi:hypothetical protein GCM10028796_22430 [Ramlibacter monticola]|uniref:TetR/AcrR family transcriptional regulator n=2 Tax=Ramlibacter monticola TaxID=1926872 RepID=A0A937CUC9_9BURK|nr:TetR/AcrR family transcriptional regulator [Ramlibacter monticola]
MGRSSKRPYRSEARTAAAEETRGKVLEAGRSLFSRKGIDATTIAEIARRAGVSEATVYATVKSKSGLIEALMKDALFGPRYHAALEQVRQESDPVTRIALSAGVARAIYEGESAGLSLLMKASAFSPQLRKSQEAFEALRREMQLERIDALFEARRSRPGLTREAAATLLWMFTGREVYHKLVHESRWLPQEYEAWLQRTLVEALTDGKGAHKR